MEQQHPAAAEHGSLLRPKASLLPKINTAAIQGRLLQRNASAGELGCTTDAHNGSAVVAVIIKHSMASAQPVLQEVLLAQHVGLDINKLVLVSPLSM
jgi:hypothetical protein